MTIGCTSVERKASKMEKKRCFGAALYLVLWKEGQPAWSKLGVKGLGGKGGTQHQKGYVDSRSRGNEREMSSYKSGSKTSNKELLRSPRINRERRQISEKSRAFGVTHTSFPVYHLMLCDLTQITQLF